MGERRKEKNGTDQSLKKAVLLTALAALVLCALYLAARLFIPTEGLFGGFNQMAIEFLGPACWLLFFVAAVYIWKNYYFSKRTGGKEFKGLRVDSRYNMTRKEMADFYRTEDPHRIDEATLPRKRWFNSGGIVLGHLRDRLIEIPPGSQVNGAIIGKPKSGKSVIIIDSILSILYADSPTSFCAVDLKGDIIRAVHKFNKRMRRIGRRIRPYKIFSPTDPKHSVHFDPLFQIRGKSLEEAKPIVRAMAQMLVPMPADAGSNAAYFCEVAQNFFCGICLYMLHRNPRVTFPDIVVNVLNHDFKTWIQAAKEEETPRAVSEFLLRHENENEINVGGGYNSLARSLQDFSTEALQEILRPAADALSVQDLEVGTNIFLRVSQKEMDQYGKLLGLIFDLFILEFLDRPEMRDKPWQREIWLILDEFARLGHLSSVATAVATTRSKGVTLLFGFQSLAPLQKENMYGEKGTDELLDCCSFFAITQVTSPKSQEWCSKLVGSKKVLSVTHGESSGTDKLSGLVTRTAHEQYEPVYRPEDFGDPQEFGEEGQLKVVIVKDGKHIKADIVKHWEDEPL